MLDRNVASIRAAEELELQIREFRTELTRFLLTNDEVHLENAESICPGIDRWLEEARRCALTEEEKSLMRVIDQDVADVFSELKRARGQSLTQQKESIDRVVQGTLSADILANAREYLNVNERALERSREDSRAMTGRVVLALLLLGSCGAISGLLLGYGLARGINRSILNLSDPIRHAARKLNEVVGPVPVSADPGFEDLHRDLGRVSAQIYTVVDQLQESQREMVRADQLAAIGQLAAGLAHELRNPLMAMKVLVQSARRVGPSSKALTDRDLQVLDEEISRLEHLLQTFLDFAKPARLEIRHFDMREVVGPSVQLLTRRAELKGVTIVTRLHDDPCHVDADPSQIRQVVLNLLLNALEAAPQGGTVEIRIRTVSASNSGAVATSLACGWVELEVADSGAGLPADVHDRIFEPFFSTRDTGLGLGLAICKRIVDSHDGVIDAEDGSSGGAVFSVKLPASTDDANSSGIRGDATMASAGSIA
jgi:two-component system, NtrC family, sensor histidine kinase HydH